jgi:hypothetical protein
MAPGCEITARLGSGQVESPPISAAEGISKRYLIGDR